MSRLKLRRSARAVILDESSRVLLCRFARAGPTTHGEVSWLTVQGRGAVGGGGGVGGDDVAPGFHESGNAWRWGWCGEEFVMVASEDVSGAAVRYGAFEYRCRLFGTS